MSDTRMTEKGKTMKTPKIMVKLLSTEAATVHIQEAAEKRSLQKYCK